MMTEITLETLIVKLTAFFIACFFFYLLVKAYREDRASSHERYAAIYSFIYAATVSIIGTAIMLVFGASIGTLVAVLLK